MFKRKYKIFLCYANEQESLAQQLNVLLKKRGHRVFFSDEQIQPGDVFAHPIFEEIKNTDLFFYLLSEDSIDPDRFAYGEAHAAFEQNIRILPFDISENGIPVDDLPPFVRTLSINRPVGDKVTSIIWEVEELLRDRLKKRLLWVNIVFATILFLNLAFLLLRALEIGPVWVRGSQSQSLTEHIEAAEFPDVLSGLTTRFDSDTPFLDSMMLALDPTFSARFEDSLASFTDRNEIATNLQQLLDQKEQRIQTLEDQLSEQLLEIDSLENGAQGYESERAELQAEIDSNNELLTRTRDEISLLKTVNGYDAVKFWLYGMNEACQRDIHKKMAEIGVYNISFEHFLHNEQSEEHSIHTVADERIERVGERIEAALRTLSCIPTRNFEGGSLQTPNSRKIFVRLVG